MLMVIAIVLCVVCLVGIWYAVQDYSTPPRFVSQRDWYEATTPKVASLKTKAAKGFQARAGETRGDPAIRYRDDQQAS